eukprot:sb/3476341/
MCVFKINKTTPCNILLSSLINAPSDSGTDRNKLITNQNSLFRSRDWLSANQRPVFPDWVGSCSNSYPINDSINPPPVSEFSFPPSNPLHISLPRYPRLFPLNGSLLFLILPSILFCKS